MTDEEFDRREREGHANRYPNGCRVEGHHCLDCLERLGQTPHPTTYRPGYRVGWGEHHCQVLGCSYR